MTTIRVSIVTYNNADTIERCLDSVFAQKGEFELLVSVIDNDSRDKTAEVIRSGYSDIDLVLPGENLGFGAGHNKVLRGCTEPYVLVLNPDAWLEHGALEQMLRSLKSQEDVAMVGPRVGYDDGGPQVSFGWFPGLFADMRQRKFVKLVQKAEPAAINRLEQLLTSPFRPDWISGSCFLARTDALKGIDYFDERYFLYLEDVDMCKRLHAAGWEVMLDPRAVCRHLEGHSHAEWSDSSQHFRRSRLVYENKHGTRLGFLLYKLLRARSVELNWDATLRQTRSK